MNQHIRSSELDQLVAELNRTDTVDPNQLPLDPSAPRLDSPQQAQVDQSEPLDCILALMVQHRASDLLLVTGFPPVLRVNGRLEKTRAPEVEAEDLGAWLTPHLGERAHHELAQKGSTDFSLRLSPTSSAAGSDRPGAWRFRVNLHRQGGGLAAAIRALPQEVPTLGSLNLPPTLAGLTRPHRGLVLVCGPTGSGKSTTLAALVGEINRQRTCHIVTIEDPVEYEHRPLKSLIEHVEVGRDAPSFAAALRACMRQDPDVILVGEMRDLETISTALTAAETGHLILSTLHTNDVVQAVHRIVDVFPPAQQAQIRHQLALSLHAIVAQQLIPRSDGRGRVPAVEVLMATYPVRHHIRSEASQKLYNEITLGQRQGMISLEASLANLVRHGTIANEEALVRSTRPEELESLLGAV